MTISCKKILVIDNWKSPISTGIVNAFQKYGIECLVFESQKTNHWVDRYLFHNINHWAHNFRILAKGKYFFVDHPLNHAVYRANKLLLVFKRFQPDLVFHIRGINIMPETLREIRSKCKLFGWWIETEYRFQEIEPYLDLYDRFYFYSGKSLRMAQGVGHNHVGFMPHCVDTEKYRPIDGLAKEMDWVFVGGWTFQRQQVIQALAEITHSFAIYGPKWRKNNYTNYKLAARIKGKHIWGEDLIRLYNRARVALNVTKAAPSGQAQKGMNLRVLEVLSCGSCLLTDFPEEASEYFQPESHFATYTSHEDVARVMRQLLADDDRRRSLAMAGRQRVQDLGYDNLVRKVLEDFAY